MTDGWLGPAPAGVLRGQVRARDGAPVPGARVSITASPVPIPEIAAVTDADGRFELAAPAAGEYTLSVHAEGAGAAATRVVTLPASGTEALAPAPADDPDAEISSDAPPAATVRGETSGPAAEVYVVLTFQERSGGG